MGQQPSRVAAGGATGPQAWAIDRASQARAAVQAALPAAEHEQQRRQQQQQQAQPPQQAELPPPPPLKQQQQPPSPQQPQPAAASNKLEREVTQAKGQDVGGLGEWLSEEMRARQTQLLASEADMRGVLYEHYTEQLRGLEPTLRLRGEMLGNSLLDYLASGSKGAPTTTYSQVLERSAASSPNPSLAVQDAMDALDPLITPVLHPFVEGIKSPFFKEAVIIKHKVEQAWVATGLACLLAGFVAGRVLPRDGKGKQ